nr:hypothetical protein [Lachnospira eligens]
MAELQQDTEKYVELRNINKTYGTFKARIILISELGRVSLLHCLDLAEAAKLPS